MIKIAVIDDEASERALLTGYFERMSQENDIAMEVSAFAKGIELLEQDSDETDLYCFDIELNGKDGRDGIAFAKDIRKRHPSAVIVFITNLAQMAIREYEVQAADFVLKPINYYAFSLKMQTIMQLIMHNRPVQIVIATSDLVYRLDVNDIKYVEVVGHYLYYHAAFQVIRQKASLKELEAKLNGMPFYRCNNCYLVNLKYVNGVSGDEVLIGDERLKISRPRKKKFMQRLANYMGGVEQ